MLYRYMLSFQIADWTGSQWVTAFDDTGAALLGRPAAEMNRLREQQSPLYEQTFENASFKQFNFRCRAKGIRLIFKYLCLF